jgi:hypothetical protein
MRRQASLESAGSSEHGLDQARHLEHGPIGASCRVEETTNQKPVEDARCLRASFGRICRIGAINGIWGMMEMDKSWSKYGLHWQLHEARR